ncbi:hypothetical protein [Rhodopirellula sp. P2]|uniref:hypothetical protein n=1 Tax=Rhodopirellula sp. P2 TaxID=2127060 RepID=UPI0023685C4E|nr:hypothetical protein [Rhodopirellula sp. P2]WDQ15725.1 hypothetical protein PSR62_19035 [Rhodopirellula sp. P2]
MTPDTLLAGFSARGIIVTLVGDDIKLRARDGILTDDDVIVLRDSKSDVLRWLRVAEGLPVDDDAAELLSLDEVDPSEIPTCESCGRLNDVQTGGSKWHCSQCDPSAESRRQLASRLIRSAHSIRYTDKRNG